MIPAKNILLSLLLALLFFTFSCGKKIDEKEADKEDSVGIEVASYGNGQQLVTPVYGVRSIRVRNIGPLWKIFNDSNYLQLESARRLGIEPLGTLSSAYFVKRPIVKVSSNQYYQIDSLRHSIPFLVPEAAVLLEEIGKNFIDSLHSRGGDSYKIKVTSLLRTPETIGRLRRVNINATDSSTHQYGTTFDISYVNFYCTDSTRQINQGDLKNLLGEVLLDLKQKGRCLVKYENKTGCFHITVTK
ncbi:MAG: hypothetical protein J1F12_03540 [Muribaculaceae bacterium]|nr:hypothetical protein [Muribaculaceae bacterium]